MERLDLLPTGGATPASAYLAKLAPRSQVSMRRALEGVAIEVARVPTLNGRPLGRVDLDRVPWAALDATRLAEVRDRPGSPSTRRQAMSAVRGVLAQLDALDAEKMDATKVSIPKASRAPWTPPALGPNASPSEVRDAALAGMVRGLGLRPGVAVALDVTAFRGWRLDVRGRVLRLPDPISDTIERWLKVRGSEPGPLLLAVRRGGHLGGRMTSDAAQKRLALLRAG